MPFHKLPNALRKYRKRSGFSQQEIAFLLGFATPAHVSRYEHFYRLPGLQNALALGLIFQSAIPELFSGEYEKAAGIVFRQANRLIARLEAEPRSESTLRKMSLLRAIISINETASDAA